MITNLRTLECQTKFLCQYLKKFKKESAGNMYMYVRMKGLILLFRHFLVSIAVVLKKSKSYVYPLKAMPWFGVCKTPERNRGLWPLETDSLDWAWSGYPNAVDENE